MISQLDAWADRPLVRSLAAEAVLPKLRGELRAMEPRTHEGTCEAAANRRLPEGGASRARIACARACDVATRGGHCLRSSERLADFEDIRQYRQAVQLARSHNRRDLPSHAADPEARAEMGIFRSLLRHEADGILVPQSGRTAFFAQHRLSLVADFSLNAANE